MKPEKVTEEQLFLYGNLFALLIFIILLTAIGIDLYGT